MYNEYSTSYGLVVKPAFDSIIVLQRRVPYCVQSFFFHLSCKNGHSYKLPHFQVVRKQFEAEWMPRLKPRELKDYQSFLNGEVFEDEYDFPHGQLPRQKKQRSTKIDQFCTAYREFREESGFRFDFTKQDIERYPVVLTTFEGLDGFRYEQYYFMVDNPKDLQRDSLNASGQIKNWNYDRLVYTGQLMPLDRAYEKFLNQQTLKCDAKHLLCSDTYRPLEEGNEQSREESERVTKLLADGKTRDEKQRYSRKKAYATDLWKSFRRNKRKRRM